MKRHLFIILTFTMCLIFSAPLLAQDDAPVLYPGFGIEELIARTYGEGEFEVLETLAVYPEFTRQLIRYDSDGLSIYGFMNVPVGEGPFPVVIAVHGFVPPDEYETLAYTTPYTDALARAGYLVIHPNLRGHVPSDDDGVRVFEEVGYAIDVLNLIAHIREQGLSPGPLALANGFRIGLWGHSMGGIITLRVITVDRTISSAVLYGSMSADERVNFQHVYDFWTRGRDGIEELNTPAARMAQISPLTYMDRIRTRISLHHGTADASVPLQWGLDLCDQMAERQIEAECFFYEGEGHLFSGEADTLFQARVVAFFRRSLG